MLALMGIFSTSPAIAVISSSYQEGSSSNNPLAAPSPAPGPRAAVVSNPPMPSSINLTVIGPIVQAVEVGFINRATGTPGLLEGPRLAVSNVGGASQIVPTIVTIVKNNAPLIAAALQGLSAFGAAS